MSSTNSSSPIPDVIPPAVVQAIIQGFAKAIGPSVGFVLIGSVFAGSLIPVIIALFYFSTPATRTKPIFVLNILSLLYGIGIAIWNNHLELNAMLNPGSITSWQQTTAFGMCFQLAPWLSEMVLALRLLVVFPPRRTPKWKLVLVFAFPVIVKTVRLASLIIWYKEFASLIKNSSQAYAASAAVDYGHSSWARVQWIGELLDNLYCSSLFIWKLHQSHVFRNADGQRITFGSSDSFSSRIKALFWIAVGNFVFPVIFDIILIVDLYVDPRYHLNIPNLLFASYYVEVHGVVFATLWSSSFNYIQQQQQREKPEASLPWRVARPRMPPSSDVSAFSTIPSVDCTSDEGSSDGVKTGGWDAVGKEAVRDDAIPLSVAVHKTEATAV